MPGLSTRLLAGAGLSLLSATTMAQIVAPLPPPMPWRGASENLPVPAGHAWITPAEASGFDTSPTHAESHAYLRRLAAASPLLTVESFGLSPQGREMIVVHARKPGNGAKPLVLVEAGIHPGEIDGSDAGLMLLRDIAMRGKDHLLNKVDLAFVPIFNVDGHARSSAFNRPNQRGPRYQGWRTTSQNYNLNREWLKADAPEMQAMLALIQRLRPSLFIDLHTTDGIDHQYDVAFAFAGWDGLYANSPAIGRWLDQRYRPAVSKGLAAKGHTPGLYVESVDNRDPRKGLVHNADTPQYSTGYGDLARIPTVLVETHSLKTNRQRVLGTYVLLEESLKLAGAEAASLRAAIAEDRAERPKSMVLRWRPLPDPIRTVEFKGGAFERYQSPITGRSELRWLGKPATYQLPVYGETPDVSVRLPAAWWVPAEATEVIARLRLHGVQMDAITAPRTLDLEMTRLENVTVGRVSEGRPAISAASFARERRRETLAAGSVRVPADQPLALVAAALLEPESPHGALANNFFPGMLQRTEYMEAYVIAPMAEAMLKADPKLKAEFAAKLAADPDFAADGNRRLAWFYQRSPYYDDRYLLFPVGREIPPAPEAGAPPR
jgi:hypothetical protein